MPLLSLRLSHSEFTFLYIDLNRTSDILLSNLIYTTTNLSWDKILKLLLRKIMKAN